MRVFFYSQPFCLILGAFLCGAVEPGDASQSNSGRFAALAARAEAQQATAVAGIDGWLFLTAELRHLGVERFWGNEAKVVNRAANAESADPLPALVDFNTQLKQAGIELIVMPVPPKAAIYPDKVPGQVGLSKDNARIDEADTVFYQLCSQQGINVLDLTPVFQRARKTNAAPLYCRTDSHWSGVGCVLAADLVSHEIRARPWLNSVPKQNFKSNWQEMDINGDLADLVEPKAKAEKIRLRFVTAPDGSSPADWRESPILLLGDSHTLVFHAGEDMHGTGAGLADQLALELGFAVDVVGVRGSGATPARINLLRRKDNLHGKKLVIWCFSAREFTEASGGWRLIPIIGNK